MENKFQYEDIIEILSSFKPEIKSNFLRKNLLDEKSLDKLIDSVLEEVSIIILNTDLITLDYGYIKVLKENRRRKKKKALYTDKSYANSVYNKMIKGFKTSLPLFDENFDQDKCNDLIEKLDLELDKWSDGIDILYSDYKFAKDKTKRFKNVSLKEDISIYFFEKFVKKTLKRKRIMLNTFTRTPIDTLNNSRNKVTPMDGFSYNTENLKLFAKVDYEQIRGKSFTEIVKSSQLEILNGIDLKVLDCIIRLGPIISPRFLYTGFVRIPIRTMVMDVFGYDTKDSRKKLYRSLRKLTLITLEIILGAESFSVSRPLYKVELITKELLDSNMDVEYANIDMSKDYLNEIVDGNIIDIDFEIKGLNRDAEKVIFNLQKERMIEYYERRGNDDYISKPFKKVLDYRIFQEWIIMRDKNKYHKRNRIKDCLDSIIDSGKIIKSYEQIGDNFIIEFLPFSKDEINELNKKTEKNIQLLLK